MKVIGNLTKDAIIRALVSEGSSASETVGSEAVFETANSTHISPVYDSNENKTAIFYQDGGNSNYGTAIVATLSGTSLSYGSPVVFEAATTQSISAAFDSNSNKIVIAYTDSGNSSHGTAIVGTISGTSISFGSPVVFNAASTSYNSVVFDSSNNKIVICYQDGGNSNYGTAIVGTVSGTSISFGSEAVFESAATAYISAAFDSNSNKVVIAYEDDDNSDYGTAIVGTVSGTSISFGSAVVFESASVSFIQTSFDSTNNKVVIAYRDDGNSYYGTAIVGTVSGTSISFGTAVVYLSAQANNFGNVHDSNAQKNIIYFREQASSGVGTVIVGTVSGTSISFNTKTVVNNASTEGNFSNIAFDSTGKKVIITFRDEGNSNYGTALAYQAAYDITTGGTIADGKPVIVNANGTVSTVSQTAASLGTEGAFNSSTSSFFASVFDNSNNKHIITYRQGNTIRYVVATVASDGSVSFGTDAQAVAGDYSKIASAFDSTNNRIVIVFKNGATYAMVGSLSGTTVTWGSVTEVHSTSAGDLAISFDSTAGKVVIVYKGASSYGRARVGTVSGTSISFGTEVVFNSGTTDKPRCAYDSTNDKTVVSYANSEEDGAGYAVVGTISGTDISFGSSVEYESGAISHSGIAFDSDTGKVVIAYRQNHGSSGSTDYKRGTAVVGTVSGTSISFGTPVAFDNSGDYGENTANSVIYDSNAKKVLVVYPRTLSGSYSNRGFVFPLAVSGTTVVADTPTDFAGATAVYPAISFDSNVNKSLIAFGDAGNSEYGTAVSFTPLSGNLTTENFVGFMDGAALDGTNGEILSSCSIARNQTSLTPGQTYFVTPAGALSTTAGSPSVTAGTAISSTELIVKG